MNRQSYPVTWVSLLDAPIIIYAFIYFLLANFGPGDGGNCDVVFGGLRSSLFSGLGYDDLKLPAHYHFCYCFLGLMTWLLKRRKQLGTHAYENGLR